MHTGSALRPGDTIEVTIEKGVYRGLGLARHEGQVVFVPRGLPGEHVQARIARLGRGYATAEPTQTLEPAAGRRPAPCPHFARCGGCVYQELVYPDQLAVKEAVLRESLVRAGVPWDGPIPIRRSPEEGWRTRATFHLEHGPAAVRLGFHEEGTRRLVHIERCLQVSPELMAAAGTVRDRLHGHRQGRRVRHLEVAESARGDERVVCLHGAFSVPEAAELSSVGEVRGVSGLAARGYGGAFVLLRGSPFVHADVLGRRLRAHVLAFFQVNRFLLEDLARAVVGALPPDARVLDLYAGAGLFALSAAGAADEVVAVERSALAVADARANAEAAALRNVRIRECDVAEALAGPPPAAGEHVILDPPRTGAGPGVVASIAARRPGGIVYVSCDPPTLGRDLAGFARAGYGPESVEAFDLFPDTFHLEALVRLRPR
jgi:23S rRNA (uracil1939-C5)-methyltransferase